MFTGRPDTHWRGFHSPWSVILEVLRRKVLGLTFVLELSRQRQQYWWRGFQMQCRVEGEARELQQLFAEGVIVATHSLTDRAITSAPEALHPIFAFTTRVRSP